MSLRATALARKWCAYCKGDVERMNPNAHHYHGAIEAALREVVERCIEIAGVVHQEANHAHEKVQPRCGHFIAAAIRREFLA